MPMFIQVPKNQYEYLLDNHQHSLQMHSQRTQPIMQLKNIKKIPVWPEPEMLGMHVEVNGEEPTRVEHVQSGDQNHKS